jgi:outer membrane protein TolC
MPTIRSTEKLAALKGHDFSRALGELYTKAALAAEEMQIVENIFPQRLKPRFNFAGCPTLAAFLFLRLGWVFAAASLLTGCKPVGPNYNRPGYQAPAAYKETGASTVLAPPPAPAGGSWRPANPSDGMIRGQWWEIYEDPQLNRLEERIGPKGQPNNQTLRQALETYLAARDQVTAARASLFPTLSAGVSTQREKISTNGHDYSSTKSPTYNDFLLSGQASWEPDFWGRIRRTVEAARSTAQASAADLANIDLSLHAEMAADYFQLRGLDAETALLKSTVADLEGQLDLTQRLFAGGIGTDVDVAQARTQLETTRAQLIDVGVARAQYEHAIGTIANANLSEFTIPFSPLAEFPAQPVALSGAQPVAHSSEQTPAPASGPTSAHSLDQPHDFAPSPKLALPQIPLGLPSQLLERRPDIAAAERRMAAANAQIGIAVSAFYPTISLNGAGGFESEHAGSWIQGPSALWSLGAQATELLFDAGQRHALTDQARHTYEAQAAAYRSQVLLAFNDVEDQLSGLRILEQESAAEQKAVASAQHSYEISNRRYGGGVTSYLEVLTSEATLLQNQRASIDLETRQFAASVGLLRSLGGGWDASQLQK